MAPLGTEYAIFEPRTDTQIVDYLAERHVLEDPEVHEQTCGECGQGMDVPETTPHCDWCWEEWPCEIASLLMGPAL